MNLSELSIPQLIDEYVKGPKLLRDAVAGMTREQLLARPIAGKWSTLELIAHLADFEPVYGDRMKRIIAENEPTLFSGDPDKFAAKLAYHERDLETEQKNLAELKRRFPRDPLHHFCLLIQSITS